VPWSLPESQGGHGIGSRDGTPAVAAAAPFVVAYWHMVRQTVNGSQPERAPATACL